MPRLDGRLSETDMEASHIVQLEQPYKVLLAEDGGPDNLVSATRQVVAVNRLTGAAYCFSDEGNVVPCSSLPVIDVLDPDETMEDWLSTSSKRKRRRIFRALESLAKIARG